MTSRRDSTYPVCCFAFSKPENLNIFSKSSLDMYPNLIHVALDRLEMYLQFQVITLQLSEGQTLSEKLKDKPCHCQKAGKDPRLASSQRPITLLSHIAKLFERITLRRLHRHLTPKREQFELR
ncbi:hypothetical protein EVAR_103032_1 [Eumeta japonica]|uniref:Uncharacterized protein n=1 Tax=Eumeta variegata TaxID=151549 RepID=A0A4C1WEV7_EUMVA|nr:hypothetical protein EVAR_103032_1 [Eumeta japonica]